MLLLLHPIEGGANYLGIVGQEDPDHLICIFPVHFFQAGQVSTIQLVFDASFHVISDVNLNSGLRQGYQLSAPAPIQPGSDSHSITISFHSTPVPLCIALASRRTTFSVDRSSSLGLIREHSFVQSGGRNIALYSDNPDRRALPEGAPEITILSHQPDASVLFRLGRAASRLRTRASSAIFASGTQDSFTLNAMTRIPRGRWPLYLELCNRLRANPLPGITAPLFQHIWFEHGVPENLFALILQWIDWFSGRSVDIARSSHPVRALDSVLNKGQDVDRFRQLDRQRLQIWGERFPIQTILSQLQAGLEFRAMAGVATERETRTLQSLRDGSAMTPVACTEDDPVLALESRFSRPWDYRSPASHQYRRVQRLGQGGQGTVWRVTDGNKEYALKETPIFEEEHLIPLMRLIAILQQHKLDTSRIIPIIEQWSTPLMIYQVMPLMSDGDLFEFRKSHLEVVEQQLPYLVFQIIDALAFLHLNQVVHRDVKPMNFLVERQGNDIRLMLADLGLMREVDSAEQMLTSIVGTVPYMGQHTAHAYATKTPYSGLKMEYENIAITLVEVATGVLMFYQFTSRADSIDQGAQWQATLFSNLFVGEHSPEVNLSEQLPHWLHENKDKMPDGLLEIVTALLSIPAGNCSFHYLAELLETHPYFEPYRDKSEAIQLKKRMGTSAKSDPKAARMAALQALLPEKLVLNQVAGNGDCLPAAIAMSFNQQAGAQSQETALDIRRRLAELLKTILHFIEHLKDYTAGQAMTPEQISQQQQFLYEQLFTLTGIHHTQIEHMLANGTIASAGVLDDMDTWLDPGFLPLVQQLLNVNINVNSPSPQGTLQNEHFSAAFWHQNAPTLAFYLQFYGHISLADELPDITIMFNGQRGSNGHYYYITEGALPAPTEYPGSNSTQNITLPTICNRNCRLEGVIQYHFPY